MNNYELLLFDIDGTLLDFEKSERNGIKKTLNRFGLRDDDEIIETYRQINISYWEMFENDEISKESLLVERHEVLFEKFGMVQNAEEFNNYYEECLSNESHLMDHAIDILTYIKSKNRHKTAIVTNGLYNTQVKRIKAANLNEYFDHIYISEKVGYNKPQVEIFDYIFNDIGKGIKKEESLIIGDSLTSDIKGGNNYGIDTCWINPKGLENKIGVKIDYEIQNLEQLKNII